MIKEEEDLLKIIDNYEVISFDLFDTLIFRPFNKPSDLFEYIEDKYNLKNFKKNRIKSERNILKNKIEASYNEIYQDLKVDKNIEKEEELRLNFTSNNIKQIWEYASFKNKKIIVVSDTYYDKSFIKKLLVKNEFNSCYKLYISSELQLTKRDNNIWNYILKDLNISSSKILHIGDNVQSDVKKPKIKGISTFHMPMLKDVLFKTDIRQKKISKQKSLISSQYVGVSQSVDYKKGYWYRFGYCYAGIILYSYAKYIFENVKKDNIQEVLFVARDGYFLKKIFDKICKKTNSTIESTYFYLNRAIIKNVNKSELKIYLNTIIKNKNNFAVVDSISAYRSMEKTIKELLNLSFKSFYFNLFKRVKDNDVRVFNKISDTNILYKIPYVRTSELVFSSYEVEILSLDDKFKPIYKSIDCQDINNREKKYEDIFSGAEDWFDFFTTRFDLLQIDHKFISKLINYFGIYCNKDDLLHISEYNHYDKGKVLPLSYIWILKKCIFKKI